MIYQVRFGRKWIDAVSGEVNSDGSLYARFADGSASRATAGFWRVVFK